MIGDILKFYRAHARPRRGAGRRVSLGEFLDRARYSDALVDEHVLPMCAAIWSTTPQQMRDYPMRSFLRFFSSHGLLQLAEPAAVADGAGRQPRLRVGAASTTWATGSRVRSAARRVVRQAGLSIVEDRDGRGEVFTDVVIAAHADEALALLAEPSADERAILGAFRYTPNTAVLHDDVALMPKRRSVWSSWNYIGDRRRRGRSAALRQLLDELRCRSCRRSASCS